MKSITRFYRVAMLLALLSLFVACATKAVRVELIEDVAPFSKVAVLPFNVTNCLSCVESFPSCRPVGGQIVCDRIKSDVGFDLAQSLAREIAIYGKYEVVEPLAAARVLPMLGQVPLTEIGRRLGVDVLLFGTVNRFQERVGGPRSVESPASVCFEVSLVDARSGRTVWYAVFDQTQQSLSDDITNIRNFVRGGGKWLTAREFADVGIAEMVEHFPGLKGAGAP
ncbi:MAG: hypothetical protein JXR80_10135 [Deltaproteobacteria bacterium]|nr:hypothetical protein [Deltaproteobacteria bacterium]